VLLLSEVLAPLVPSDEFLDITQSCGPVESSLEILLTSMREDAWLPLSGTALGVPLNSGETLT
jgi:hypothetical protein